jgi:hypothetical protein
MWQFWRICCIAWTCNCPIFSVSVKKKCSERTTIDEHQGSHCKSDESTNKIIEKWFPGMLSKAF